MSVSVCMSAEGGERARAHPPRDSESRSARKGFRFAVGREWGEKACASAARFGESLYEKMCSDSLRRQGVGLVGERGRAHPPRDVGEACHEKVGSDSLCRQGVGREDTRIRREILRVALREKGF